MQVIHRPAPMVRTVNPKVDSELETIIDRCLQKSPDRRYQRLVRWLRIWIVIWWGSRLRRGRFPHGGGLGIGFLVYP